MRRISGRSSVEVSAWSVALSAVTSRSWRSRTVATGAADMSRGGSMAPALAARPRRGPGPRGSPRRGFPRTFPPGVRCSCSRGHARSRGRHAGAARPPPRRRPDRSPRRPRGSAARRPGCRRRQGRAAARRPGAPRPALRGRRRGAGPLAAVPLPQRQQARCRARPARRRRLAPLLRALRARRRADREPRPLGPAPPRPHARRGPRAASAPRARRACGLRAHGPARRLAARGAAGVRRLGRAACLRLPRAAAVLAPRLRGTRLRRGVRGGGRAGRAPRPPAPRRRADGRGLGAGGGAQRHEPVVDPARRLRAPLPDAARLAAAQRRRRVPRARDGRRLRARAARLAAAVAGVRRAPRPPGRARAVAKEALAGRARADVLAEGRRLGVPITPVNTPEEFVAEEQTRVRGYFRKTGFPHLGDAPFAPAPFNFSRTPAVLARPAPAPGAPDEGSFPPRAPGRPSGDGARRPALAGLCVIDLGCGVAIPETGTLLAELGAEVIKVESRANIDFPRRVTVEPDAVDRSWTFNDASRGQLSVALDLRTPRGRELALA